MGGQKNNSNDETTPDSNKKTTKLNNAHNCDSKIIEWIKSESFKNFFISFSWLGVIYLAFSRFTQQFYNIKEINWYIIIEIITAFFVYLIVIALIFLYQLLKVFNFKGREEIKEVPFLWVALLIFGPVIITILIRILFYYILRLRLPSLVYELILFVIILAASCVFDYFFKKKYRVKLSAFFLRLILLTIYFIFIIKSNVNPLLIDLLRHLKK